MNSRSLNNFILLDWRNLSVDEGGTRTFQNDDPPVEFEYINSKISDDSPIKHSTEWIKIIIIFSNSIWYYNYFSYNSMNHFFIHSSSSIVKSVAPPPVCRLTLPIGRISLLPDEIDVADGGDVIIGLHGASAEAPATATPTAADDVGVLVDV